MANNQTTQEAAQALGFESLNGIAFGRWQGYAVSHYMNQNWYSFQFAARVDKKDAQLRKTLLEDMKARCPKRCKGVMLDHSYVMFNMSLDRKVQLSEQMTVFMNAMADALRAAGATRWQLAMRLVRTAAAVAAKGMAAGLPAGAAIGWYAARRTGATWPGLPPYFEIPWRAVAEGTLAALAAVFAVAVPAFTLFS